MTAWPPGIVFHDIRKPLPYAAGSAEAIYSAHMLEHLYFDEAKKALVEFRRLLSPAGVLRLALPDSELLARVFLRDSGARGADAALEFNTGLNAHPLSRPPARRRLSDRLGASIHRWQPTHALVTKMLLDAGFGGVTECTFLSGDLPDLATVEHRPESFFLEARVPASDVALGTTGRTP
jgi:SAM-dependent methyltransferase